MLQLMKVCATPICCKMSIEADVIISSDFGLKLPLTDNTTNDFWVAENDGC
jgi:hypothetical protein